jgi:hypothetical protein
VSQLPGVEQKGDTMPYTSLNGHMFSVPHKDGSVALRLPQGDREKFLKKYKTTLASQYGAVRDDVHHRASNLPGRGVDPDVAGCSVAAGRADERQLLPFDEGHGHAPDWTVAQLAGPAPIMIIMLSKCPRTRPRRSENSSCWSCWRR